MPNLKLVIDGETKIDGNPGQWQSSPPPLLTEQLKAGAKPQPWMRAALMPLADAIAHEAASQSGMRVPPLNGDWTLTVRHVNGDTEITVQTT